MEKDKEVIRTSLRMTKSLYERLNEAASDKGVTMHSEIIARLEQSFDPLIVNVRNGGDMMDEIAKIAERVVRTIREDERKAGLPPMPYDPKD